MKRCSRTDGFTIVEVLIVLAVTGMIFLSAVLLVSGQTSKTEFTQAIQQVQTQLQQVIGDVVNGYYPNGNNFSCSDLAGALSITAIAVGNNTQGTNGGCIFLGKAVQFGTNVAPSGSANQAYSIYPIVGLQCTTGGSDANCTQAASLSSALPAALYPNIAPPLPTVPATVDESQLQSLGNGLTVFKVSYVDSTGTSHTGLGTIGFLSSLAQYNPTTNQLVTGAQQVSLWVVGNTNLTSSRPSTVTQIDSATPFNWNLATSLSICFASGTTNQSGLLTIGSTNGRQTSVDVQIYGDTTC